MIILRKGEFNVRASCANSILKPVSSIDQLNEIVKEITLAEAILVENILHQLSRNLQIELIDCLISKTKKLFIHTLFATPATYVRYESSRYVENTEYGDLVGCRRISDPKTDKYVLSSDSFIWEIESICQYLNNRSDLSVEILEDFYPVPAGCERLILIKK